MNNGENKSTPTLMSSSLENNPLWRPLMIPSRSKSSSVNDFEGALVDGKDDILRRITVKDTPSNMGSPRRRTLLVSINVLRQHCKKAHSC